MQNIPQMLTIAETSKQTGIKAHSIRRLCLEGRIKFVKIGTKYLINLDRFIDFLNGGNADDA